MFVRGGERTTSKGNCLIRGQGKGIKIEKMGGAGKKRGITNGGEGLLCSDERGDGHRDLVRTRGEESHLGPSQTKKEEKRPPVTVQSIKKSIDDGKR